MSRSERQWRLVSGLVLAAYLLQHLLGLWLGIISFDALEQARRLHGVVWGNRIGTGVLYGALLSHLLLGLMSLYRRRSLRMPLWEGVQMGFGLVLPFLLVAHVVGTRLADTLFGANTTYDLVISVLWSDSWLRTRQVLLLLVVWVHVSVGLHYWLRLRRGYGRWRFLLHGMAWLVPALALAGFVRAGLETSGWDAAEPRRQQVEARKEQIGNDGAATLALAANGILWGLGGLYLGVLALRGVQRLRAGRGRVLIHHPRHRALALVPGQSVLEAFRSHAVAHASVCGGKARCTTCRVRVGHGADRLAEPESAERAALSRIRAPANVRLACQLRPRHDLHVTPLLSPDTAVRRGGVAGREQQVVAMFVDLRGSTALGEAKLPYDVVFVLNRFFAEMSEALDASGGHYAQFAGDGLLALYGLDGSVHEACGAALAGAVDMGRRLDGLSEHLREELAAPLVIGIGIHVGEAIVGTMGPPSSPNLSAVGDNINVAARLESLTKDYDCALVVSRAVLDLAGVDAVDLPLHQAAVRGREGRLEVVAIADLDLLAQRLPARISHRPTPAAVH